MKPERDVLLTDLKYRHIDRLSNYLDSGYMTWKDLGNVIFDGDSAAKERIRALHLLYCGGQSPAKDFWNTY